MQATHTCMEAHLLGVILPRVIFPQHLVNLPDQGNFLPFHSYRKLWNPFFDISTLFCYLVTSELIGRIRVHGHASNNLNFPCLVPHGACLLHHYCRAGHLSAGLLLAWSTFEPRYWISCPRHIIYVRKFFIIG